MEKTQSSNCSCIKKEAQGFDFVLTTYDCKALIITDLTNWMKDDGYIIPDRFDVAITLPNQAKVNVEFSGKFTSSNLEWFYSLDDTNGVYITADLLQLNQSTLEQIQKLVGYYDSWSNEWATKIAEEYKNDVTDEENEEEGPEPLETEENTEEDFGGEGEL